MADVTRLDTAASGNTSGASYTVAAGSNRALFIAVQHEGAITPSGLSATWGGQAMTGVMENHLEAAGNDNEIELFMLLEAGIAAASGSTITFTGHISGNVTWHAASYAGVNQTGGATTIPTTNTAETTGTTPNPLTTSDISVSAGSATIAVGGCGNGTTATWTTGANPCTEQTDQQDVTPTTTGSMADRLSASAETVDVECFWASQNRAHVIVVEVAKAIETAAGAPSITKPTASGTAERVVTASGTPSITKPTSAGTVALTRVATGSPPINVVTASGTAARIVTASGSPSITKPTAAGSAVKRIGAAGSPSITPIISVGSCLPYPFKLSDSADIAASGENTTAQLIPPVTKTTGDFGGGRIQDDENPGDAVNAGHQEYREDEWSIVATTSAIDGAQYEFRIVDAGAPLDSSPAVPKVTISGAPKTASGSPSISAVTAAGSATRIITADGAPSIGAITATGASERIVPASGAAAITPITSTGSATRILTAFGSPTITPVTASGLVINVFEAFKHTLVTDTSLDTTLAADVAIRVTLVTDTSLDTTLAADEANSTTLTIDTSDDVSLV